MWPDMDWMAIWHAHEGEALHCNLYYSNCRGLGIPGSNCGSESSMPGRQMRCGRDTGVEKGWVWFDWGKDGAGGWMEMVCSWDRWGCVEW